MKQLGLNLNKGKWGGRRDGSGRKSFHSQGVRHRSREKVTARNPTHINIKYHSRIRNKDFLQILKRAILNGQRKGLRILHYSVLSNHIHFIIEANNNAILTSGMRSMTTTLAKGQSQGIVQIERYHLHVLKCPKETKNAFRYVVFNHERHGGKPVIDAYSSVGHYLNLKFDYCVTKMDKPVSWLSSARD